MFYKLLLSLLLILPPLLFSSCDNESQSIFGPKEDVLPPITTEGKDTFGCLLNGEVWVYTPRAFANNLTGDYSPYWKIFNMSASIKHDGILESYITFAATIDTLGVYDFMGISFFDQKYSDLWPMGEEFLIEEDNYLEITHLDIENSIISGLFQFTMLDTLYGDTLRFTEGRFDYKWAN